VVNKLANLTDIFHRDQSQSPASLPKESGDLDRKTHRYFFLTANLPKEENSRKFASKASIASRFHLQFLFDKWQRNISHRGLSITLENNEANTSRNPIGSNTT